MSNVKIDFTKCLGKIKNMHAVNNGPVPAGNVQTRGNGDAYAKARFPYARNHDAGFFAGYGGEHTVDIHAIFPDFDADVKEIIKVELERRYYSPKIREILAVKERFGFSYWKVRTDDGTVNFTIQDTYRNLIRVGDDRAVLLDVDGNRFEIPSFEALSRKSYKKIELYL